MNIERYDCFRTQKIAVSGPQTNILGSESTVSHAKMAVSGPQSFSVTNWLAYSYRETIGNILSG